MSDLTISFEERPEELDRLGEIFDVSGEDLTVRLAALAAAAFEAYRIELSGVRSISTLRENRELRLCLLYKYLPAGEPTDVQIGQLFQLTPTQVANLVAGTWARFRPELEEQVAEAIKRSFEAGVRLKEKNHPDKFRLRLPDSLARSLRDVIGQTNLSQLRKVPGVGQTYDLQEKSAFLLCDRFKIDRGALPT